MSDDEEQEKPKEDVLPPLNVRTNDLPEFLFKKVVKITADALAANKLEKDAAAAVKTFLDTDPEFNELPGKGPWQCIIGKSFAASVTHEAMHLVFFDMINQGKTVLLFKSLAVQNV